MCSNMYPFDVPLRCSVHENGQVHFASHIHAFHQQDFVAQNPLWILIRDEFLSQHAGGKVARLSRFGDHVHTALEARLEGAQATAARQDLSLDHHITNRFAGCPRKQTTRDDEQNETIQKSRGAFKLQSTHYTYVC
jgi:hypothetical protein